MIRRLAFVGAGVCRRGRDSTPPGFGERKSKQLRMAWTSIREAHGYSRFPEPRVT